MASAVPMSRVARSPFAALLAYLALLFPALLPFGIEPAAQLFAAAPHSHADGIDPSRPHDHGGDQMPAPTATGWLMPFHAATLTAPLVHVAEARIPEPVAAPPRAPIQRRVHDLAQPRAPPLVA